MKLYFIKRYVEAETALSGSTDHHRSLDELVSDFGDQACFALQLLAKICVKTERKKNAADAFKKALKLNPFLWSCFVELCNRGEKPDANRTFQLDGLENLSTCHGMTTPSVETVTVIQNVTTNTQELINTLQTTPSPGTPGTVLQSTVNNTKMCTPDESPLANPLMFSGVGPLPPSRLKPIRYKSIWGPTTVSPFTPNFGVLQFTDGVSPLDFGTPNIVTQSTLTEANDQKSLAKRVRAHVGQLINRKEPPLQNSKPVFSQSSNVSNTISTPSSPATLTSLATQNVRRSSRLFSNSYSVKENNKSPNRNKFQTPKSPSRKNNKRLAKANLNKNSYCELNARNRSEKERTETITSAENKANSAISTTTNYNIMHQSILIQKQCAEGLMALMRTLGQAYLHLSQFECRKAIEHLTSIASHQFNTAWVQNILGKAYFELAEYEKSITYFSGVHKKEPYRLEYMDIYSTALWHLQKEVTLSALAQDLIKIDKESPITWCVAGNCFSLHKEHDTAIKFFQRAVQVDSDFPYAYTLLGHEYIMTEELDKALSSFRNAIRLDCRHYNAWFGIGTICSKQERYRLAEIYYSRALEINTHSSVLMCHIGVVQHALKKVDKALQTLNAAIANNPKNPLCKFHRGQLYFNLGRHAEALKELEELKEIVPKESLVYYLIGKVHKKLGNVDLALTHFSWATDLDPKGASSQIKEAFDPSAGRPHSAYESPQSPSTDEFPSRSVAAPTETSHTEESLDFVGLPEDSDDSL